MNGNSVQPVGPSVVAVCFVRFILVCNCNTTVLPILYSDQSADLVIGALIRFVVANLSWPLVIDSWIDISFELDPFRLKYSEVRVGMVFHLNPYLHRCSFIHTRGSLFSKITFLGLCCCLVAEWLSMLILFESWLISILIHDWSQNWSIVIHDWFTKLIDRDSWLIHNWFTKLIIQITRTNCSYKYQYRLYCTGNSVRTCFTFTSPSIFCQKRKQAPEWYTGC